MLRYLRKRIRRFFRRGFIEIEPDEIFLDSSNLPEFDRNQFEGRIEKPIQKGTVWKLSAIFAVIFLVVLWKVWNLQVVYGEAYSIQSEINRLRHGLIFSERGIIYDRNGEELVWNTPSGHDDFSKRAYTDREGFAHVLGYLSYPLKDSKGVYYQEEYIGIEGIEREYDRVLGGHNGLKIIETNARDEIQTESVIRPPQDGKSVTLSIDARVQEGLHTILRKIADASHFNGSSGILMDVRTGEVIALTNYPEYDPAILTEGGPADRITEYAEDTRTPFLNRATSGLYAPGSIIKPFIALGALNEGVVTPDTEILSTGVLSIPNPFNPELESTFADWKAHGYVDVRDAISVSSDIYFYEVTGGYEDQKGIGIDGIERYVRMFGIGSLSNIDLPTEAVGTVPDPEWKEEHFPGDIWRVGDTYHTAIGQYGFQVTPIQMVRAVAAIATGGTLREPSLLLHGANDALVRTIQIPKKHFKVVEEGMRQAVTSGTAVALYFPEIDIAAKTGTAEVGAKKEYVNSWTVGYFPYDDPHYAFVILMERAPQGTLTGSVAASQQFFRWMMENTPEYLGLEVPDEVPAAE